MIRNKSFINFICAISIATVLLVSITGRTIPVKAVGTTATIAGTAFVLTGAVFLSYVALTQGQMLLPVSEELHNWLGSIGRKISQYPSGASTYQELYQGLAHEPVTNIINGVWTWTKDKLISFANDFSDTRIIQNILAYSEVVETVTQVTNHYHYEFDINAIDTYYNGYTYVSMAQALVNGVQYSIGSPVLVNINNNVFVSYYYDDIYRNVLKLDGSYGIQRLQNGTWSYVNSISAGLRLSDRIIGATYNSSHDAFFSIYVGSVSVRANTYPILTQADTYIESTGEIIEADDVISVRSNVPSWTDPDNDNRPIVPWVPIPNLPVNVNPPSEFINSQWGFNLQDLLDILEDLAGTLIDIGGIAGLINEFAGLHGDEYYIEYNDGDTNYYTYYQPTVFDNDTEYITYNIDVSDEQYTIPVDLNTIQIYTDNNYLKEIKQRSSKFGETLGEYFVFWHNSDPMTVYVIFGSFIVILIGAFIGKWGHS